MKRKCNPDELKTRIYEVKLRKTRTFTSERINAQTPLLGKKRKSSYAGYFRLGERMKLSFGSSG